MNTSLSRSIQVYSKREKKNFKKTLSAKKFTEEEILHNFEIFKQKINEDNEKYEAEKIQKQESSKCNLKRQELSDVVSHLDKHTGNSILCFASSKSGKSFMLVKLLDVLLKWNPNLIPVLFLGNPNAEIYKPLRGRFAMFEGFRPSIVETLRAINGIDEGRKFEWLVILDDIVNARHSEILRNCLLSWRNSGISCIGLLQNATLINKNLRGNASVYLYGRNKREEITGLMSRFLKTLEPFRFLKTEDKSDCYNELTQDYNFLVNYPNDSDDLYLLKA
jgi:hypothetical protein